MFVFNIYLKLAGIAVGILGGLILMFTAGFWYGFPFLLLGLGLLASYFLLGTVQSAALLMEKMDFAAVDHRLNMTILPKWLYRPNRAYYFLMKGTVAGQKGDYTSSEKLFILAKEIGLPGDNEKAMVDLQLANLAANRGKWQEAQNLGKNLKKYKVTENQLREQIKQFEKAMANRGQMKVQNQMMGMGNRMRRPRMR